MARPTPQAIFEPFKQARGSRRVCQAPGCPEEGLHRAPVSRDHLDSYYWFCLQHVREYNLAWNYYEGMSEVEIERHRRFDTVWQRPTWPLGHFGPYTFRYDIPIDDDVGDARHGGHGETGGGPNGSQRGNGGSTRARSDRERALAVLDLQEPVTLVEVKVRYKALVKKLHPDTNGGDTRAEDQLKTINQAYATLKASFA